MRRTLLLVALVPLAVGCGAAPSSSPGLGGAPEKMVAAGSSRISVSYGGKQFFAGEFDFKRKVGSFAWGTTKGDAEWDQILASDATYTRILPDLFPRSSDAAWLKFGASLDLTIPEGQELTVEFFDFGLDVVAKAPPSEQVVTLEELVRLQFERCSENEEGRDDPTACGNEASIHTWRGPTLDLKP